MIEYNPKTWLRLIFHRYSRETFKKTLPNMISISFYSTIFTVIFEINFRGVYEVSPVVHSLLGIVLGLFLVFRMNTAYDKWWEGRIIWGGLVNDCRNLSLKLKAYLTDKELKNEYARLISSYPKAMKEHLRFGVKFEELPLNDNEKEQMRKWEHRPNFIASELYRITTGLYTDKKITGDQLFILDKELKALTDHVGKCERIKSTPIPYAYSMYIKKFIFIYSVTLPMGFVSTFHYWTILVVAFIFYFLITIELIAEEIEDPFGLDENDLPTDQISEKIEKNVTEILVDR